MVIKIFFAALYAFIVINFLPILNSIDSETYLYYAENSLGIVILRFSDGFFSFLMNEPLWLLINIALGILFESAEFVVKTIGFLNAFLSILIFLLFLETVKSRGWKYILIFMFCISPLILSNYVVNLRQGMALNFFLLGLFFYYSGKKYWIIFLSPFVHSMFFIVLFLFFISKFILLFKQKKILFYFLVVIFSLVFLVITQSEMLTGFRQLTWEQETKGSGFFLYFWLIVLFYFIFFQKRLLSVRDINLSFFSVSIILFYIVSYSFFYGSGRILQALMVIILFSIIYLNSIGKFLFSLQFSSFILIDVFIRLGIEDYGF